MNGARKKIADRKKIRYMYMKRGREGRREEKEGEKKKVEYIEEEMKEKEEDKKR